MGVKIRVKCPSCSETQFTRTTLKVRCFHCNKSYDVFPGNGRTRIIYTDPPDVKEQLEKLYYRQRNGK